MMPRLALPTAVAAVLAACERPQEPPPAVHPPAAPAPSAWQTTGDSALVAVKDDPDLAAAIEQARATAGEARRRWLEASGAGRDRWAVKWAAPTVAGGVEHVWVRPVAWTRFRLEGWLASPPHAPLACGRAAGELVSFPVDELSDWVRFAEGSPGRPAEGGYTTRVLESRFGAP